MGIGYTWTMTLTEKSKVERILADRLVNASFFGLSFYAKQLILLFKNGQRDYYLRCESLWEYFTTAHNAGAYQFQRYSTAELAAKAALFALKRVVSVRLDEDLPNLSLIFGDDSQLYISGHDEHYECWQFGEYQKNELIACQAKGELSFTN
jgi:hypothetical protein